MTHLMRRVVGGGVLLVMVGGGVPFSGAPDDRAPGEWPYFGGDKAFTRYSPLAQINRDNVADLRVVWRRPAVDPAFEDAYPEVRIPGYFRSTPIMLDGMLLAPNGVGLLRSLDPGTGETIWQQEPFAPTLSEARGRSPRGIDTWGEGADRRLLLVRNDYLYALSARTGEPYAEFGDRGRLNLNVAHQRAGSYAWSAGPIVVGEVVVIAGITGGAGDGGNRKEAVPEDVRGYSVRTGELLWTFNVVPKPGQFGNDTWEDDSWKYSGDLGSWCCATADEELGYVYVPLTAPTAAYYGGHRPGDNLFSNSLVALDAKTGKRVWHFQMVHHDVWEYDTVGPATLGEITVEGRRIKAVMQPSKTGFLYVFDRQTGEPVWPIEERPVPQSAVPGERLSPTQPFPTKPPPFDMQGFSENDLIDFTPELRARALELIEPFELGPMFTPPSVVGGESGGNGTLIFPGGWGSGNWNTGAFDPETGFYYAVSHTMPNLYPLSETSDPEATLTYEWAGGENFPTLDGLPIFKPPYGRITAYDMNRGEEVWMAANGDGPLDHPLLEGLDLPPLGMLGRPAPMLTKTLLFLGESSDAILGIQVNGNKFRAYDKADGSVLWETELSAGVTGAPITYEYEGRQYIVVAVGGNDDPAEWVAFALGEAAP